MHLPVDSELLYSTTSIVLRMSLGLNIPTVHCKWSLLLWEEILTSLFYGLLLPLGQCSGAGGGDSGILLSDTYAFGAGCLAESGPAIASGVFGLPLPEWNLCFTHELVIRAPVFLACCPQGKVPISQVWARLKKRISASQLHLLEA